MGDHVYFHALPVHLHLLCTWSFPGRATSSDPVRLRPDHQGGVFCSRCANLVLFLLDLDVRSGVWTCAMCNFVHLYLLFLRKFVVRAYSANNQSRSSSRERTISAGRSRNWFLTR